MHNWERSFPAAQLPDHSWIINVLEDLVNYCEHHELNVVELEVRQTLGRIANCQEFKVSHKVQKIHS